MKILGISRAERFSPNSVERDRAVFSAVTERLRQANHSVETIGEDAFEIKSGYDAVFSMGRSENLLRKLLKMEEEGIPIINSPSALQDNNRAQQAEIFKAAGVPIPETKIDNGKGREMAYSFWLKSAASAQQANDVCFVHNEETYRERIAELRAGNTQDIILQVKHEEGDLVKFYGVEGTEFFSCSFPAENGNFSKFGHEVHNSPLRKYDFSRPELQKAANKAATLTNIAIYGGDAIVRPDGTFVIIDFNDWPSFSACKDEAATHIAQKILQIFNKQ